jgi:hypothetical protein
MLSSLSAASLRKLGETVEAAADQLEARVNPLGLDLGDEGPDAAGSLRGLRTSLLPSWDAASALHARAYRAGDGSTCVRVASSCASSREGERCSPAWGESASYPAQVSFLAWPLSRAVVLRPRTPAAAAAAAAALRQRIGADGTHLALVIGASEEPLALGTGVRLAAATERLWRLRARLEDDDRRLLEALRPSGATGPLEPLLDPSLLVVVPRRGALSAASTVLDEVGAALDQAGVRGQIDWIHPGSR